jgi:hypothetical protein
MRLLTLALLCVALGGFRAPSVASTEGLRPISVSSDITKPPPDPAVKAVEELRRNPFPAQQSRLLDELARHKTSPVAARELVEWVEFDPQWMMDTPSNDGRGSLVIVHGLPAYRPPALRPAARGLIGMGKFAVPYLAEGYLTAACTFQSSPNGVGFPEMHVLGVIICHDEQVARCALEYARRRLSQEKTENAQSAWKRLIKGIVQKYPGLE